MIQFTRTKNISPAKDTLVILEDAARLREIDLERGDRQYLLEQLNGDANVAVCDVSGRLVFVHRVKTADAVKRAEKARCAGNEMVLKLLAAKREEAQLVSLQSDAALTLALAEGAALARPGQSLGQTHDPPPGDLHLLTAPRNTAAQHPGNRHLIGGPTGSSSVSGGGTVGAWAAVLGRGDAVTAPGAVRRWSP